MRVCVYLCSFREARQMVSRHYVAHISLCREIGVKELPVDALEPGKAEELARFGELQLVGGEAEKVLGFKIGEGEYLRLVLLG